MEILQRYLLLVNLLLIFSARKVVSQFFSTTLDAVRSRSQCDCMEYWQCVGSGGKPYSYCSYSSKVCCFIDPNSISVGILPRPTKSSSCGTKGPNSERDGISEPGEWAWHVSNSNDYFRI
ncbi:protein masquerade [Trichonephila clavipes]|nr:protein masquerade [Trichonephila clavipes]